jgi:hypothetical protein
MKNIIKNTGILIFILISCSAIAQNGARVVAAQGGTGQLKNGTCTITLLQQMNASDYYVTVTPHGNCNALYITKQEHSFIVTESKGETGKLSEVEFDYVIFKKRPAPVTATDSDAAQPAVK